MWAKVRQRLFEKHSTTVTSKWDEVWISYVKTRLNSICDRENHKSIFAKVQKKKKKSVPDVRPSIIFISIYIYILDEIELKWRSIGVTTASAVSTGNWTLNIMFFLHVHGILPQADKQLHLKTRNKASGAGWRWVMIGTSWPSFNLQPHSLAVTCSS